MVRLFVYTILAVAAGLMLTLVLAQEPGYVLVSFGVYSFETSLFALAVALLCLFVVWRLLMTVLAWINPLRLFKSGREWSIARSQKRRSKPIKTEQQLQEDLLQALAEIRKSDSVTLVELRKFWKKNAKAYKGNERVVLAYIDALLSISEGAEAIATIEACLQENWLPSLVLQYGFVSLQVDSKLTVKQMQRAEQWLDNHSGDAVLLLTLGRLSLRNELWGKAREYFDRSLRESSSPEAFAELARLLLNLKEQEKSGEYLRMQTKLVSKSLAPFPQPKF